MLNTKLILVDGITGSGKSTTAHYIARQLEKNGIKAKWLYEEEKEHPLHVPIKHENEVYSDYTKREMVTFPELWRKYINSIKDDDYIYIIESYPLQDVFYAPFANDTDKSIIKEYIHTICSIAAELNPVLIYFYQQDIEQALHQNCNRRSEIWKNYMISKEELTPYCINRNLRGENAFIQLWRGMSEFSTELYNEFIFHKISIENSEQKWSVYRKQILDFLDIEQGEEKVEILSLEKYCGLYIDKYWFNVHIIDDYLCMDQFWKNLKLRSIGDDRFEIEGFPVVLQFFANENGEIQSLKIVESKTGSNIYMGGEEGFKISIPHLELDELKQFCGEYYCESDKLTRKIYLKEDGDMYYWRAENNETKLLPISIDRLAMHNSKARFEFPDCKKQFVLKSIGQDDLLFTQTNS